MIFRKIVLLGHILLSGLQSSASGADTTKHSLNYLSGVSVIPNAVTNTSNGRRVNFIKVIGAGYQYQINKKWGVLAMGELQTESYMVTQNNEIRLRENIFMLLGGFSYELLPHLEVYAGAGAEVERNFTVPLLQIGVEYHLHIANNWYVSPELSYDLSEIQQSITGAFKFTRKFGSIKHLPD